MRKGGRLEIQVRTDWRLIFTAGCLPGQETTLHAYHKIKTVIVSNFIFHAIKLIQFFLSIFPRLQAAIDIFSRNLLKRVIHHSEYQVSIKLH